uniref:Uncharacterized protein n=1 Tax=Promethearchaeum syntrophicum TaxID=2594042 RepID=A0A5B9D7V7_9ARCH|nr:hypothetical protein DSAG12_01104 [Candidatus Prometheoarchaeum syntrophicum]
MLENNSLCNGLNENLFKKHVKSFLFKENYSISLENYLKLVIEIKDISIVFN